MKEISLTETDDCILPPPDGNIILTKSGAVVMTIETLMRATDNVVQIAGLRTLMSRRRRNADKKRKRLAEGEEEGREER